MHLLTVRELAEELRVPVSWVYARSRQRGPGSIPRIKVGKYLRFEFEDVLMWLRSQHENQATHSPI